MKKFIHLFIITISFLLVVYGVSYAAEVDSGAWGGNLVWILEDDGSLTIAGSGVMNDLSSGESAWRKYKESITSVEIEDGITNIGAYAFYGCSSLTEIIIPDNIISFGEYSFSGCSSLASISMPKNLRLIGNSAFSNCRQLTSVNVDSLLTWCRISFSSLTSNPLYYTHSLCINGELQQNLVFPDGLGSIKPHAFAGFSNLLSITIPNGVTSIGDGAFWGCSNLVNIELPSGISSIGDSAFRDCINLVNIEFLSGLSTINYHAFYRCTGLKNITIPNSVTKIDNSAFYQCTSLINAYHNWSPDQLGNVLIDGGNNYLVDAIVNTSSGVFVSGNYGDNIQWSLNTNGELFLSGNGKMYTQDIFYDNGEDTELNWMAVWFPYAKHVKTVYIDAGITSIQESAFSYNYHSNLTNAYYAGTPEQLGRLRIGYNNTRLISALIDSAEGLFVAGSCGDNATWTLDKNGTLCISGEGLTKDLIIGHYGYDRVPYSSDVWWPYKSVIRDLIIEDGITGIGAYSFQSCSNLQTIHFPSSLSTISQYAFNLSKAISRVYYDGTAEEYSSITIQSYNSPLRKAEIIYNTIYTVSYDANGGDDISLSQKMKPLQKITILMTIPSRAGWFFLGWSEDQNAIYPDYVPGDLFTDKKDTVLYAVWGKPDCIFPNSLIAIDEESFTNCAFSFALIPDNVEEIKQNAFSQCDNLRFVLFSPDHIVIDENAFNGVNDIIIIALPNSDAYYYAKQNGYRFVPIQ